MATSNANLASDLRPLIPHLSEYFGIWAIWDQSFKGMFQHFRTVDIRAHIQEFHAGDDEKIDAPKPLSAEYRRLGGGGTSQKQIAFLEVTGPMMKFRSSMGGGTSTVQVRRQVRAATADPLVGEIVIHFDTPGGTYAGTADLGADIANAARQKPVTAFVSDLCGSAGYWCASQAREIVATKTSMIGSIGTFLTVEDSSGAAAAAGVKVHVLRAGAFKGRTVDGIEVDAEALGEMQRLVNELNDHFVSAVADGRRLKLETVRELADGRVHLASDAQRLGLINRVSSLDDELARINNRLISGKVRSMTNATPQNTTPVEITSAANDPAGAAGDLAAQVVSPPAATPPAAAPAPVAATPPALAPATLEQLEAACPGADASFVLSQLKSGATVAAATTAFIAAQQQQIAALQQQTPAAAAAKPARDIAAAGVDPLQTTSKPDPAAGRDAIDQMRAFVREKTATGMTSQQAMKLFNREHPELRQMAIAAANS